MNKISIISLKKQVVLGRGGGVRVRVRVRGGGGGGNHLVKNSLRASFPIWASEARRACTFNDIPQMESLLAGYVTKSRPY